MNAIARRSSESPLVTAPGTFACLVRSARGEDRLDSDVDLLVEMQDDRSLLDLVGLEQELEELLHRKVDVLTDASIHPAIRQRITAEARAL